MKRLYHLETGQKFILSTSIDLEINKDSNDEVVVYMKLTPMDTGKDSKKNALNLMSGNFETIDDREPVLALSY